MKTSALQFITLSEGEKSHTLTLWASREKEKLRYCVLAGREGYLLVRESMLEEVFRQAVKISKPEKKGVPRKGEKPEKQIVKKVNDICKKNHQSAVYPHHIHVHHYGIHTEMTLHIKLDKNLSLERAHNIASMIEDDIRNELGVEATIHTEPRIGRIHKTSRGTNQK